MLLEMLKSKIHRATITEKNINYEGSLSVDPQLMQKANMRVFEKVQIANINNGYRLETYLIAGSKGEVCLNGAAGRLGEIGDKVIIISYCLLDDKESANFKPIFVQVDKNNNYLDNH